MRNLKKLIFSVVFSALVNFTYGVPDKLRAVFTDDPSTTISIIFDTNKSANTNPRVYYSTSYSAVQNNSSSFKYRDSELSNAWDDFNENIFIYNNIVKLDNLIPDKKYYFKIKDNTGETQIYYFETIPDNPNKKLSFICGGDSRDNRSVRQIANIIVSKLKPHAVFFDGDFTDDSTADEWIDWFDDWQLSISSDGRVTPLVPARGNHENNNGILATLFGTNATVTYALSFGGNLFRAYTLNSKNTIAGFGSQTDWFRQDLEGSQDHIYRFAQYHEPMRPVTGGKPDGAAQYAFWSPLFYQYNVDLVLEGDSHTASTTYPIIPCTGGYGCVDGFKEDANNGTVFTGQGSWGAPLRPANEPRPWTFHSDMLNQFKLIFVDKEKIELRTISYESSLGISEVSTNNRFALPAGLSIETGDNKITGQPQDVLIIPNKKSLTYPKIEIELPEENATYNSAVSVEVSAKNLTPQNGITEVEFFLDGVSKGVDYSKPFSFQFSASEFNIAKTYEINAVAYNGTVASPFASKRIKFINSNNYTVSTKLKGNFNDAEQLSNSKVDVANYDLDMGDNNTICGLRFTNVNVPPNATINSAKIIFTADEVKRETTSLVIYAEDDPNSIHFLPKNYNISQRIKAPVFVNWDNISDWGAVGDNGPAQTTPDIKNLVQYLVKRSDWEFNSPMTFIIEGDGHRVAETYDSDTTLVPILTINYSKNDKDCYDPIVHTASNIAENSAILKWDNIRNAFYKVYYKPANSNDLKTYCTAHPVMFLFGLNSCTQYQFKVEVICGDYNDCVANQNLGYQTAFKSFQTVGCGALKTENNNNNEFQKVSAN